ncbi:Uncharacterised protein [Pantoea agglomerans]|uniref:Uncharacterized protein n=1 Tax=Enterobacter agglomerans TaxID=549 RepID=A0A379AEA9_ENTAG|nr:Uncharacterised protein [Pantoea agglomerans]
MNEANINGVALRCQQQKNTLSFNWLALTQSDRDLSSLRSVSGDSGQGILLVKLAQMLIHGGKAFGPAVPEP